MYRSPAVENKELMTPYGAEGSDFEKDEDSISEENDLDSECSEEARSSRSVRSSLSLEIHGLQREKWVYFTNQEYYRRLVELKSNHLRNMADLERMYISQGKDGQGEGDGDLQRWRDNEEKPAYSLDRKCVGSLLGSGPTRRLQRINSQEELDFHDSSSGSDQSELCGEDLSWNFSQDHTFERVFSPEQMVAKKTFRFQLQPQGWVSYQTGARVQSNSKVTVPRPFKMMLREEERKKHRVRTRSEIELENTLLKRELEELRECQKKFTASPAPAHIHLPLYEIISSRPRSRNSSDHFRETNQERTKVTPKPFKFLERERRKREAKIAAELVKFGQKDQRAFKARALPSSVYRNRHGTNTSSPCLQHQRQTVFIMERETTEGQ